MVSRSNNFYRNIHTEWSKGEEHNSSKKGRDADWMPYIKRIELKGFKSFGPDTVKVVLDKGFTAIIGPNGSGKTNILDAFLFSLGELSTKRLRVETAAKLIFHASEKSGLERAKMAKVIIQFDNTDGRMAVDTTTVTISREVYRNGQSGYRLNGRRISRIHSLEILSMAGVSSTSQNIIPQGTITRLTDISPSERRKIIEDLVGIGQYDAEKAEAEDKLRQADIQIKTATGRIDEVQKRVDDLECERNQLLRFNFISNELVPAGDDDAALIDSLLLRKPSLRLDLDARRLGKAALAFVVGYLSIGVLLARTRRLPSAAFEDFARRCRSILEDATLDAPASLKAILVPRHPFAPIGELVLHANISAVRYFILLGLLERLLARFAPNLPAETRAALTVGPDEMMSRNMLRDLKSLASIASERPTIERLLLADRFDELPHQLAAHPDAGPFVAALADFLNRYGHRGTREVELSSPRWREDPTPLFAMIRNVLRDGSRSHVHWAESPTTP